MNESPQSPQSQGGQQSQSRAVAAPPKGSMATPGGGEIMYTGIAKHSASLRGYLKWALISVAGGAAAIGLNMLDLGIPGWILAFGWLIGLPGILWTYLVHISNQYKVSLRRVETECGVFSKKVDSLELWRVLDVEYSQTLIDRIFDNGRIRLVSTDQTDPELLLHGLPGHRALFEQLRDAVQNARQTNRPMELVGSEMGDGAGELMM